MAIAGRLSPLVSHFIQYVFQQKRRVQVFGYSFGYTISIFNVLRKGYFKTIIAEHFLILVLQFCQLQIMGGNQCRNIMAYNLAQENDGAFQLVFRVRTFQNLIQNNQGIRIGLHMLYELLQTKKLRIEIRDIL